MNCAMAAHDGQKAIPQIMGITDGMAKNENNEQYGEQCSDQWEMQEIPFHGRSGSSATISRILCKPA
jgi:hypothetical protein